LCRIGKKKIRFHCHSVSSAGGEKRKISCLRFVIIASDGNDYALANVLPRDDTPVTTHFC
jgi:hypothetical protein